jgi:hypothetical protein
MEMTTLFTYMILLFSLMYESLFLECGHEIMELVMIKLFSNHVLCHVSI